MTDREYLAHVAHAIEEIKAHTAGMSQDEYEAVHQYFGVNQKILWDVLQEDLDPLLARVREILAGPIGPAATADG